MSEALLDVWILLQVIEFVDVPTLLNLRLLNKSINGLISRYETSITQNMAKKLLPEGARYALLNNSSAQPGLGHLIRV